MTTPQFEETGTVGDSKEPAKTAAGKNVAARFAAVRARGVLNAGLDILALEYEKATPGYRTRWEYYAPGKDGGLDLVGMREGFGWKVVDWSEMPNRTATMLASGPVRRGDLVLMTAPAEIVLDQLIQDAQAAEADLKSSEAAFKESVEKKKVTLGSGESDGAKGIGSIKVRTEEILPRQSNDAQGG